MSTPDMDVIKEIPGYRVILKAVLKSQIQQLVEQLAAHTEEESIILTASVADGTLSHLGSDSGKSFLEDHEDVKSQFLGFCLKWHHKKNQEKEREEAMRIAAVNAASPRFMPSRPPVQHFTNITRFHGSSGQSVRSPGMRHQPYPMTRPVRATPTRTFSLLKSPNTIDGQIIKIEPNLNEEPFNQSETNLNTQSNNNSNQPSSPSETSANVKNESSDKEEDANSESSSSTIPNETPPEGLSLDSDLTNLILSSQNSASHSSDIDRNVCVKVEAANDSEMDLEITGVEPARPIVSQSSWTPNSSMGMNFDPLGATGCPADVQAAQQGYNSLGDGQEKYPSKSVQCIEDSHINSRPLGGRNKTCFLCGRTFCRPSLLDRHVLTHTGERPFECNMCNKRFTQKCHLKSHMLVHREDLM